MNFYDIANRSGSKTSKVFAILAENNGKSMSYKDMKMVMTEVFGVEIDSKSLNIVLKGLKKRGLAESGGLGFWRVVLTVGQCAEDLENAFFPER